MEALISYNVRTYLKGVAFSLFGHVRVIRFGCYSSVFLDEVERIVHESPIASLVSIGVAVDELLLGQGDEFVGSDLVDAFHGDDRGESPTAPCIYIYMRFSTIS